MQNLARKQPRTLRVFRVGILGASMEELSAIDRVFSVTQFRTRQYNPVRLPLTLSRIPEDIDIVIVCQGSGDAGPFSEGAPSSGKPTRPMVRMVRNAPPGRELPGYAIKTPLNPVKLLRLLDRYTIKELNYFPEFEIGGDSEAIKDEALAGLRMLKQGAASSGRSGTLARNRALVVDDSLAVRKQMEIEFDLMHQQVDLVDCAETAMQMISANRYSIIFLDVVMPGMDGYTACKKIKRSPLNQNTPVIMLTSRSSSFDKFKGTLAGCDAYLVKPINHNEFEHVLKQHTSIDKGEKVNGGK